MYFNLGQLDQKISIDVASFKLLSLPWFDACVNLYLNLYSPLESCCLHFLKDVIVVLTAHIISS